MIERSRFASLLAIVAFLYVIIVLSKLNNPMPPDGQLIAVSLYTAALLSKGSFTSTLVAVLAVPFCVTTVHADYNEKDYYRVEGPGDWNSPDAVSDTISIDAAGKIIIRMSNMKDSVKVTLAVDKPSFGATVRLTQPDTLPPECKRTLSVNLDKNCMPTWKNDLIGSNIVQLGFDKDPNYIYLPINEQSAVLTFDDKSGVTGKATKALPNSDEPASHTWDNTCKFDKVGTFNGTKSVIILEIAPVQSSACVMSMELNSDTYLLLENKYLPTTTAAITTLQPTGNPNVTNSTSSAPTSVSGNNDADRADIGVIVGASCGALLILILIGIAITIVCLRRRGKKRQPKKYQEEGQYHGIDSLNQSTVNKSSQADKSKKEKAPAPVAPPHGPRCTTDANGYEVIFPATPQRGSPKQAATPPQDNSTKNPQPGTQNEPAAEGM